jgi:hypothetical protein
MSVRKGISPKIDVEILFTRTISWNCVYHRAEHLYGMLAALTMPSLYSFKLAACVHRTRLC